MTVSTQAQAQARPAAAAADEKFVVQFEGDDYDITDFLDSHPGGKAVLLSFKNRDLTKKFYDVGHSDEAVKMLLKRKIHKSSADLELLAKDSKASLSTQFVLRKLFTPEDEYFVHKALGFLALASFVYRYCYVLPTTGTLGMEGSVLDLLTVALHLLLSCSSLIFHVLRRRIPARPLIIYEEYRLHAIVFTVRGCAATLLGFYCQDMDANARRWLLGGSHLLSHLVADRITALHGTRGVTAVRNDGVLTFQYLGLFYSFYQIAALGSFMTWSSRTADLGFNSMIAIQSSALLMTLKRKNLIRWYSHAFWYSLALALSYYVIWSVRGALFFAYPLALFALRVRFGLNKYLLWALYSVAVYHFGLLDEN